MKQKILFIFILLPLLLNANSQKYRLFWDFKINKLFTVDKYTAQTIIKNGKIIRKREIRDYIVLLPTKKIDNRFLLKGRYYSYQRPLNTDFPFQLNEVYDLKFYIDERGYYEVPQEYIMPTIRNIPVFPKEEIEVGAMWQEQGIEIMEFKPPVIIPVNVNYQFAGIDNKKFDRPTAKIVYSYIINYILNYGPPDIPYKFMGSSFSTLWYDIKEELPKYIENIYDITFIYPNGTIIQYSGELKGYYNLRKAVLNKEKEKEKIVNEFKKEDKNLNVKKSDEGVVVEFGDIYFKYKSAEITKEARKKLDRIGKVLKGYKDYNVIVKGHTDNIGSKKYNQKLSEERAKNVLDYLIKKGYINKKQGSYRGYGEEKPVADNSTEEGRRKNRRVEIVIIPE